MIRSPRRLRKAHWDAERAALVWDQSPIRRASDGEYCFAVASVADVLNSRTSWCLECLARHTRLRVADVMREIDRLAVPLVEGRCGECAVAGPVFRR